MKRLLLYVHYNKYNEFSSHVHFQLEKMRPLFSKIIFISNSQFPADKAELLKKEYLIDEFIQRQNSGYDFSAWRDGMTHIGFEELKSYDSVTLMNDTCFGPLWDMSPIYDRFETDSTVDFWGITNNRETKKSLSSQGFREHLQSYFLSFKQSAVTHPAFKSFWQTITELTDVQEVIDQYETKITTSLLDVGLSYGVLFDTTKEDTTGMLHPDFSYYNPTAIINNRVPFLKVKALEGNQLYAPFFLKELSNHSDYPQELMINHMSKIYDPTANYLLAQKYHTSSDISPKIMDKKIAIHLHTFYVDLLEEFLDSFATFQFPYDLYLTTDTEAKKNDIQQILDNRQINAKIVLTGNVGRDVLPMFKLKNYLEQYDYVGHFHTKKSKEADYWAGQSWRTELIDMLVKPSDVILSSFAEDDDLGLMIADIPSYFRFVRLDPWTELGMVPYMEKLWKDMGITKEMIFKESDVFVMSYGTFIWFKYDALKPLFELEIDDKEVPKEPLPQSTILHAIERMVVYVAWAQGYDFRIRQNPNAIPGYVDNRVLNTRQQEQFSPYAYIDFTNYGGITGAIKYLRKAIVNTTKYIMKRGIEKIKS